MKGPFIEVLDPDSLLEIDDLELPTGILNNPSASVPKGRETGTKEELIEYFVGTLKANVPKNVILIIASGTEYRRIGGELRDVQVPIATAPKTNNCGPRGRWGDLK